MIGYHQLNRCSSRSHCIFTIHIESHSHTQSNTKYTVSKLNMVDLAGSERLGKTQSKGATELEAMHINKSLTFLEQAVIALEDKTREHIPFRQSKLTHILKDSIGGKCHTVMLANIWGEKSQIEETVSIVLNIYISIGPWIYHDRVHSDSLCLLGCLSVYLQISLKLCCYYWHLVLPKGVHSNHPCQSICPFVRSSVHLSIWGSGE